MRCFKCGHDNSEDQIFFCEDCGVMLPALNDNPYKIFSLEEQYDVDLEEVEKKYNVLQGKLHPDNFPNIDKVTELLATQHIMLINHAYQILLSPRLRSEFLLKQRNIIVNQDNAASVKPPSELLMEVFALNERAAEIDSDLDKKELLADLDKSLTIIDSDLSSNFRAQDYDAAAVNSIKYRYFSKILEGLL